MKVIKFIKFREMASLKEFTIAEVKAHNTEQDLYVIIHDKVYDLTKFLKEVSMNSVFASRENIIQKMTLSCVQV